MTRQERRPFCINLSLARSLQPSQPSVSPSHVTLLHFMPTDHSSIVFRHNLQDLTSKPWSTKTSRSPSGMSEGKTRSDLYGDTVRRPYISSPHFSSPVVLPRTYLRCHDEACLVQATVHRGVSVHAQPSRFCQLFAVLTSPASKLIEGSSPANLVAFRLPEHPGHHLRRRL